MCFYVKYAYYVPTQNGIKLKMKVDDLDSLTFGNGLIDRFTWKIDDTPQKNAVSSDVSWKDKTLYGMRGDAKSKYVQ